MNTLSKKEVGMIDSIFDTHHKLSCLAVEIWDYDFSCNIGFYIKKLDMFKHKFFGSDNLKKHKVGCIYGLPNFDEISDKIYEEFKPVFRNYRKYIANHLWTDKDLVKARNLMAYLYYHYEGWIKRYFKEEERRE